MNMPYDSLNFARKLKRLGVPENQANAHAQILAEFKESHLASKDDIKEFKAETKNEFQSIRNEIQEFKVEVKNEFKAVKSELRNEIQEFKVEVKNEFKLVRNEMQELKTEVKNDIEKMGLKVDAKIDKTLNESKMFIWKVMVTIAGLLFAALKCFP